MMKATKFDSKCKTCGAAVTAGTGSLERNSHGKWTVRCDACAYRFPPTACGFGSGRNALTHPTFTGECDGCGCTTSHGSKIRSGGEDYDRTNWRWTCEACFAVEAAEWATAQRAAKPARKATSTRRSTERRYRMVNDEGVVIHVTGDDVHDARQDGFRGA